MFSWVRSSVASCMRLHCNGICCWRFGRGPMERLACRVGGQQLWGSTEAILRHVPAPRVPETRASSLHEVPAGVTRHHAGRPAVGHAGGVTSPKSPIASSRWVNLQPVGFVILTDVTLFDMQACRRMCRRCWVVAGSAASIPDCLRASSQ